MDDRIGSLAGTSCVSDNLNGQGSGIFEHDLRATEQVGASRRFAPAGLLDRLAHQLRRITRKWSEFQSILADKRLKQRWRGQAYGVAGSLQANAQCHVRLYIAA